MGVLADFIVATEEEAMAYDGIATFPESHRAQYKRLTELELGTLYHILQGKQVDDHTLYEFEAINVVDGGEQLTTRLLPDLVERLRGASDGELKSVASLWGATEEIQCSGDEMLPLLEDLRRLAKLAQSESKDMYLWNCV